MRSMISLPLFEAMRRHNRELKKARTFIRGKRKKNEFELRVIGNFEIFAAQAVEAERGMERLYEIHGKEIADGYAVCHGEPDYHHILSETDTRQVTEFNQMHLGVQMEDLYYFLRKIMEKCMTGRAAGEAGHGVLRTGAAGLGSGAAGALLPVFISGKVLETDQFLLQRQQGLGAREEYGEDQKAGGSAGGEGELYTDSYSRRVRKKPGDRNYG